jgi:hypothetical protein
MSLHAVRTAEPGRRRPSRAIAFAMDLESQSSGSTLMDAVERDLKSAVERHHGRTARLAYIDAVSIVAAGRLVWNGTVLVFDLDGQPEAERVYAWFPPGAEADGRQAQVVRHSPCVQSAHDAVTAALGPPTRTPASAPIAGDHGLTVDGAVALRHLRS